MHFFKHLTRFLRLCNKKDKHRPCETGWSVTFNNLNIKDFCTNPRVNGMKGFLQNFVPYIKERNKVR